MPIFNTNTTGIPDFSQLGALGKIGLVLQNVADPSTLPQYQQALNQQTQQNLVNQARQTQLDQQSALGQLYQDPAFLSLPLEQQLLRQAQITGDGSALANYQASQQLTPYQAAQLGIERQKVAAEKEQRDQLKNLLFGSGESAPVVPQLGGMSTPGNIAPDFGSVQPISLAQLDAPVTGMSVPSGPSPDMLSKIGLLTGNSALVNYGNSIQSRQDKASELALKRQQELQAVQVPGLNLQPGVIPTADDAKSVKDVVKAQRELIPALAEYKDLVNEYGLEVQGTNDANKLEQKQKEIIGITRVLNEAGALQAADIEYLSGLLQTPVVPNDVIPYALKNPYQAAGRKSSALAGIADYQKFLNRSFDATLKTRGYQLPEGSELSKDPLGLLK